VQEPIGTRHLRLFKIVSICDVNRRTLNQTINCLICAVVNVFAGTSDLPLVLLRDTCEFFLLGCQSDTNLLVWLQRLKRHSLADLKHYLHLS
jgi:hypothetical protein